MTLHTSASVIEVNRVCSSFVKQQLTQYLTQGKSLLLVSGGSVARELLPELTRQLSRATSLQNLTVGLVDERFGPLWHKDSNMLGVKKSGLLEVLQKKSSRILFPLQGQNTAVGAAQQYAKDLAGMLHECKGRSIGVFGMGADGHTAGMLPQPTQEKFDELFGEDRLVVNYQGPDFERITVTPQLIKQLSLPVVYACGTGKRSAIETLTQKDEFVYRQPALVLVRHPNAHLFSDYGSH